MLLFELEGWGHATEDEATKKIRELQWNTTTVALSLAGKEGMREMNVPYFNFYLARAIH